MNKKITDSILKKIHAKKIVPRERYYFIARTIIRILLGAAFLVFGMLSVALVLHLVHNFAFAEFILERPSVLLKFFWFGVPVFWIILSVVLWVMTKRMAKQTKRLYKIPFWIIGMSVFLIQIAGGFFLEQSQVGERVDAIFEQQMNWYQGATRMNHRMERMTENGFLVGTILEIKSDTVVLLNDKTNKEWTVHIKHEPLRSIRIKEGMVIRIIGEMINDDEFKAISWRPVRNKKPGSPMMRPRPFDRMQ